jgi:uncharacterized membrane protein
MNVSTFTAVGATVAVFFAVFVGVLAALQFDRSLNSITSTTTTRAQTIVECTKPLGVHKNSLAAKVYKMHKIGQEEQGIN